jgi:hypothetical protein
LKMVAQPLSASTAAAAMVTRNFMEPPSGPLGSVDDVVR